MRTQKSSSLIALLVAVSLVPALSVACRKTRAPTATTCDALADSAGAALARARDSANGATRCLLDSDCVEVHAPLRCVTGCGGDAVPKEASSSFSAAAATIDQTTCKAWVDDSCATIRPLTSPSCERLVPRCTPAGCAMVAQLPSERCDALVAKAQAQLDQTFSRLDRSCRKDDECVKIGRRACHDDYCGGGATSKRSAAAYRDAWNAIEEGPCKQWREGGCAQIDPYPSPSCVQIPVACRQGTCQPAPPATY